MLASSRNHDSTKTMGINKQQCQEQQEKFKHGRKNSLSLASRDLATLPKFSSYEEPSQITKIDLSRNSIASIQSQNGCCNLSCLINLESLDLSQNRIKNIPPKAFEKLPKLKFLFFKANLLSSVVELRALKDLRHLQTLDVSDNFMEDITIALLAKSLQSSKHSIASLLAVQRVKALPNGYSQDTSYAMLKMAFPNLQMTYMQKQNPSQKEQSTTPSHQSSHPSMKVFLQSKLFKANKPPPLNTQPKKMTQELSSKGSIQFTEESLTLRDDNTESIADLFYKPKVRRSFPMASWWELEDSCKRKLFSSNHAVSVKEPSSLLSDRMQISPSVRHQIPRETVGCFLRSPDSKLKRQFFEITSAMAPNPPPSKLFPTNNIPRNPESPPSASPEPDIFRPDSNKENIRPGPSNCKNRPEVARHVSPSLLYKTRRDEYLMKKVSPKALKITSSNCHPNK
jgi:Leucine-rich repeat (LRR) protein